MNAVVASVSAPEVSETILFAAMSKLPGSTAADVAEKKAKVTEVISQLNLQRCADTYMGNRLIRGVSGGEMKRTAVACALLCSPQCMFLDEPTSGLDSAMAQEVIVNLRALQVKQGCTFVVTIHQPAPAVFDAFNRLVLLNYGRVAYFGPGRAAPLAGGSIHTTTITRLNSSVSSFTTNKKHVFYLSQALS